MKKSVAILICIICIFSLLVGCTHINYANTTILPSTSNDITDKSKNTLLDIEPTEISTVKQPDNTVEFTTLQTEPVGGGEDGLEGMKADKYRYNYYRVTSDYIDIVGSEAYSNWVKSNPIYKTKKLDEMLMVSFIKHFNITREQFDEASQKRLELFEEFNMEPNFPPYEYEENYNYEKELYEIYNADIIYTFDNELINEYYARPPELIIENGTNALGETVE